MPLFGGDPRLLAIEVILQFNRWYDVLCVPILIFHQMNMLSYMDGTVVGFIQIFFEVARVLFISSYKKANIPNFILFLIITLPFVLAFDFVWMFAIKRVGPLIQSILIGYIIQHLLEIILGLAFSYKFHKYQNGFYQFSRVRLAINDNLNDDKQSEKT
ncbi:hypothetical protein TVAG_452420 [Trichomonas vaginalis G3]|uniref:Uncharacterized protein n=1 Tax=Trichomonas vaginalis (strain ATCC PRA-98 / G3) TaxID=412133 RepID=A2DJW4_TRIV3|nr:hypothetical protein TVAGG3_0290450 [Trichomonas vaginalis G3]EAY19328.1 hypothetical protein TVAG_452420 [Trichomonas vaginalis G3]KAI5527228.1 hypothetical protein TVAGG3_0290450 [Trichomonas vaginalis G3]|eukprot:XP_001580314.1 hypothetical protein [Trichomonas vaginalis G3]